MPPKQAKGSSRRAVSQSTHDYEVMHGLLKAKADDWWRGGGRNMTELISLEARHAMHAREPPTDDFSDPFWDTAVGRISPFRKGKRCPMFNSSSQMASCVNPNFEENFPNFQTATAENWPGFRKGHTFWRDCHSIEKPLVNAEPYWHVILKETEIAPVRAVYPKFPN